MGKRGIVLIVALGILVGMAILATVIVLVSRREFGYSYHYRMEKQALGAAESGLEAFIAQLPDDRSPIPKVGLWYNLTSGSSFHTGLPEDSVPGGIDYSPPYGVQWISSKKYNVYYLVVSTGMSQDNSVIKVVEGVIKDGPYERTQ
ncbi:MAG TPA: hypothetical protein EYP58_00995 [bacterium (Candidatus Stahlbacteria)]|nr:hypothetical protein [Candidatus Stahlbacteria bacterium]